MVKNVGNHLNVFLELHIFWIGSSHLNTFCATITRMTQTALISKCPIADGRNHMEN